MALTQSTEVAARATAGVLAPKSGGLGIPIAIPFNITVPTSPGSGPTVTICTVPAGFKPRMVSYETNGLSASAAVGLNCKIGITGTLDLLMADTDSDLAVNYKGLNSSAWDYTFAAQTDILLTMTSGKTPVAAQKVTGFILGHVNQ